MDEPVHHGAKAAGGTDLPEAGEVEAMVHEARTLFRRTLATWATDVLMLRHTGVTRPTWSARGEADLRSAAA